MPGTVADDIGIIDAGRGGGTGAPAGGGDDSGSSGSRRPIPRRAYFTAMQLGLAAIAMFFMALASAYIVRKGLGTDWQRTPMPRVAWFNTAVLLVSSVTIIVARRKLENGDREAFRKLVVGDDRPRFAVSRRTNYCLAPSCRGGNVAVDKSEQQFLLSFDRGAWRASCRRNPGAVLRHVPSVESFAHLSGDGCRTDFDLLAFYGWAVGLLACTSDTGTVNRARCAQILC